jgi:hypothetical protein
MSRCGGFREGPSTAASLRLTLSVSPSPCPASRDKPLPILLSFFLVHSDLSLPTDVEIEMLLNVIPPHSFSLSLSFFTPLPPLQLKGAIETELGQEFQTFELVDYSTQVVAGTMFLMRVKVDGDEYLHVKIIKPLPHTNQPPAVISALRGMALDSPLLPY